MRKYEFQKLIEQKCKHISTLRMARAVGLSRRMFYYRMATREGFSHKELVGLSQLTAPYGLQLEQLEAWNKELFK